MSQFGQWSVCSYDLTDCILLGKYVKDKTKKFIAFVTGVDT